MVLRMLVPDEMSAAVEVGDGSASRTAGLMIGGVTAGVVDAVGGGAAGASGASDPAGAGWTSVDGGANDKGIAGATAVAGAAAAPLSNWPVSKNPVTTINIPNAATNMMGTFFGQEGVLEMIAREMMRASGEAALILSRAVVSRYLPR